MQMPISTQRKLGLLVLLQKKYLYTCKNIVTKPNLDEFLRKRLFEQNRIENCGKQYWICVATDRFFYYYHYFPILFIFIVICFVTYWHIYSLIYSFTFFQFVVNNNNKKNLGHTHERAKAIVVSKVHEKNSNQKLFTWGKCCT